MLDARHARYGALDCIVIDGGQSPSIPVILCHGYGAPGHDLAGIGPEWINLLGDAASNFRFVFPAAPHTLAELGMLDGRAWWPIDMVALSEAMMAQTFDQLYQQEPPGLVEARDLLCGAIKEINSELGATTPMALGGFSQGAMLAIDASLRGDIEPPKLLIVFSGILICQAQWQARLSSRLANTHVYQAHGMIDPVLPYVGAERLRDMISEAGVDADWHSFMGPHTIDTESIAKTAMLLKQMV
jgi:phospholipase/carboxylesterase